MARPRVLTDEQRRENARRSQNRWLRSGDPDKLAARRAKQRAYQKQRRQKLGPERLRELRQTAYQRNRDKYRDQSLKRKFGISLTEYDAMSERQGHLCAICGKAETTIRKNRPLVLSVDHDHGTGKIRKLLCNNCNNGLGQFKDNPVILRAAARYVEEHQE